MTVCVCGELVMGCEQAEKFTAVKKKRAMKPSFFNFKKIVLQSTSEQISFQQKESRACGIPDE
jgi:hypothetical protein